MASIIELAEYAVLKATNVTAALRLALKHEPDRIVSDVSKQQAAVDLPPRTQYELRRSQEHYFRLFHNANDIVYSHDLHGRYSSLNAWDKRMTGYSSDKIADHRLQESLATAEDQRTRSFAAFVANLSHMRLMDYQF